MRKQDFLDKAATEITANMVSIIACSEYLHSINDGFPIIRSDWTSPWDIAEQLWQERQKRYENKRFNRRSE